MFGICRQAPDRRLNSAAFSDETRMWRKLFWTLGDSLSPFLTWHSL